MRKDLLAEEQKAMRERMAALARDAEYKTIRDGDERLPAAYVPEHKAMQMLKDQEAMCAICRRPLRMEKGKLSERKDRGHIDHNHTNGNIRGILCGNCNLMIGFARDDIQILWNAIVYLIVHEKSARENIANYAIEKVVCIPHYNRTVRIVQCKIPDCTSPVISRGMCSKHYTRWSKTGDPLSTPSGKQWGIRKHNRKHNPNPRAKEETSIYRVLAKILSSPESVFDPVSLADDLSIKLNTTSAILAKLHKRGKIKRRGKAQYCAAPC